MKTQEKRLKKWVKTTIRALLAVICIGYIVFFFWSNREDLEIAFNFKLHTILLIMAMQFVYFVLHSYRFLIVMEKTCGVRIPFLPWFKVFILGRFLNKFVPQIGHVYRSIRLKKDFNVSYTSSLTGFLAFIWMDTLLNLLLCLTVIVISGHSFWLGSFKIEHLLIVLILLIMAGTFLFHAVLQRIRFRAKVLAWIHSKLSELLAELIRDLSDWRYMMKIILFGMVVFLHMGTLIYVCFTGLGNQVSVVSTVLFYAFYKLINYLNITPGNVGVQEIGYGFLSEFMAIGMAQGVIVSVVFRIFNYLVLFPLGLLFGGGDLLRHKEQYYANNNDG